MIKLLLGFLVVSATPVLANELPAAEALAGCVTKQVEAGGYSSADAGDSAFALASLCRSQALDYMRACESAGRPNCAVAAPVAIQATLVSLGK